MGRRLSGKIVIVTHNAGKLREMRELLAPYGIEAISAGELVLSEPEETASDFAGNALIRARAAAKAAKAARKMAERDSPVDDETFSRDTVGLLEVGFGDAEVIAHWNRRGWPKSVRRSGKRSGSSSLSRSPKSRWRTRTP